MNCRRWADITIAVMCDATKLVDWLGRQPGRHVGVWRFWWIRNRTSRIGRNVGRAWRRHELRHPGLARPSLRQSHRSERHCGFGGGGVGMDGALGAVLGISDLWLIAGRSDGGPEEGPNIRNPSRATNASPRRIGAQPTSVF
jgi:hypothetical protein